MANHNYEYLNEGMKNEIKELMEGEHGEAIKAWGFECANAAYKRNITGVLLAVVTGVVVTANVIQRRQNILDRFVRKNVNRVMKDVEVK